MKNVVGIWIASSSGPSANMRSVCHSNVILGQHALRCSENPANRGRFLILIRESTGMSCRNIMQMSVGVKIL